MPVIHHARDLPAGTDPWPAGADVAPLPTQGRAWTQAAAETLGGDALHVMVAGGVVAPLVRRRAKPYARLEVLSAAELSEPVDLVYRDVDALRHGVGLLARARLPLRIHRLPAGSPTLPALRRAYAGRGVVVVRPREGCPYVPLDESWGEPEAKLSSRRRSDLRRARRRAEAIGPVRIETVAPSVDEAASHVEAAFAVEARSWRADRGGSLAQDRLRGPFFRRLATLAAADGELRISLLHVGDRPAAMIYALARGGAFWLLKIGFDEELARCSPGMLLTTETLRHAATEGFSSYEFLGVAESWTRLWTEQERACVAVDAYPPALPAATALVTDVFGLLRARLGARLPWRGAG